jgi:hypothetical protein
MKAGLFGSALCLGLFLTVLQGQGATAQSGATLVAIPVASCRLTIQDQVSDCAGTPVLFTMLQNGRVLYSVTVDDTVYSFSGGNDSQLSPERYALEVDTVRIASSSIADRSSRVEGRCEHLGSADGRFVRQITCTVRNNLQRMRLTVQGARTPVNIQRIP